MISWLAPLRVILKAMLWTLTRINQLVGKRNPFRPGDAVAQHTILASSASPRGSNTSGSIHPQQISRLNTDEETVLEWISPERFLTLND